MRRARSRARTLGTLATRSAPGREYFSWTRWATLRRNCRASCCGVIEERSLHRVGGEQAIPFKARLICATNADLLGRVRAGSFREDLYYRINVLSLRVPPLRERVEDIEWLIDRFFAEFAQTIESDAVGVSALAYEAARQHGWPGNVRELRNRIERAVALVNGRWIMPADLFPERERLGSARDDNLITPLGAAREDAEKRHIQRALGAYGRRDTPCCQGARHLPHHPLGENEALWPGRFRRVRRSDFRTSWRRCSENRTGSRHSAQVKTNAISVLAAFLPLGTLVAMVNARWKAA